MPSMAISGHQWPSVAINARQFGPGSPQEDGLSRHLPAGGSELSADLGQGLEDFGWVPGSLFGGRRRELKIAMIMLFDRDEKPLMLTIMIDQYVGS